MTTSTEATARNGQGGALAIRPGQNTFDRYQQAALGALGIKDATNAELAVFMHYCQKTQLDPFSKQIYMISRREKVNGQWVAKQTIQVGIEGFRVIRDRAARRDGVDVEYEDTLWYDADGNARKVWLWDFPPAACSMAVIKGGKRFPAVLTFAEYVQANSEGKPTGKWGSAPAHQIEKCVEAYALRRAFPHDLGGIYIPEEAGEPATATPAPPLRVTAAEVIGRSEQPPPQRRKRHTGRGEQGSSRPPAELLTGEWERLGVTEADEQLNLTAALAGAETTELDTLSDLPAGELQRLATLLAGCTDIGDVHALIDHGEAPGGQASDG